MVFKSDKFHIFLVFSLLLMIISRLVWIQLKPFNKTENEQYSQLLSENGIKEIPACSTKESHLSAHYRFPSLNLWHLKLLNAFCSRIQSTNFEVAFTQLNKWSYIFLCFLAALVCRFLTSRWLVGVFASTILLSRGAMIHQIGEISTNTILSLIIFIMLNFYALFFKTGAKVWFFWGIFFLYIAGQIENTLLVLPLTFNLMFLFLLIITPQSKSLFVKNIEIRPLSPIQIPFSDWFRASKFRFIFLSSHFIIAVIGFLFAWQSGGKQIIAAQAPDLLTEVIWLDLALGAIDLHYGISLLCILYVAFGQHRNFNSFLQKFLCLFIVCFASCLIGSYILLTFNSTTHLHRYFLVSNMEVLRWFEPTTLTFGIVAFYDMIRSTLDLTSRNTSLGAGFRKILLIWGNK